MSPGARRLALSNLLPSLFRAKSRDLQGPQRVPRCPGSIPVEPWGFEPFVLVDNVRRELPSPKQPVRRSAISTHDLAGKDRFALFTGIGGDAWKGAAKAVSERAEVEVYCYVIGPGREVSDLYDDWARISEVEESGCVLARPDAHVAWRRRTAAEDRAAVLGRAMDRVLGRGPRLRIGGRRRTE